MPNSRALQDAIQYAFSKDAVVVGGAGNDNLSTPFYPAAYAGVLSVAATDQNDQKPAFSNYGSWVSLSAPGDDILTTFLGQDYGPGSGTSISAPLSCPRARRLDPQPLAHLEPGDGHQPASAHRRPDRQRQSGL